MEIRGSLLARNAMLNFIGQVVPLVVGVVTIPFIIKGLGTDRFGLLSLTWVVLGFFAVFDLGLGWATTKFVAEALGKGEWGQVPRLVWTSVTVQMILGIVGGFVLAATTPFLVERVLNIPPELMGEAKGIFYLLALFIPVGLVSHSFSGLLQATQRFDLVNAVRIPASISPYILTLAGLLLGFRLPGIVALILLAWLGTLVAVILLDLHLAPGLRRYSCSFNLFPRLFSFGGWVMVSSIVIPIFVYLDRFLIGSLQTMSAIAYYTVPYGVVTKLLIIPASIASVLFPAFSSLASSDNRDKLNAVVIRSMKYVIMAMAPLTIVSLVFGEDILRMWLGDDFATKSAFVFRLLSIAVLLSAIGYIPSVLIQGVGRPDVIAKYHLIELPVYFGVAFFLIYRLGINGAALALCLRMIWTIPIFSVICLKIAGIPLGTGTLSKNGIACSLIVAGGAVLSSITLLLLKGWGIVSIGLLVGMLLIGHLLLTWFIAFDRIDKHFIKSLVKRAS